jgi:hypothetical protein
VRCIAANTANGPTFGDGPRPHETNVYQLM